MDKPIKLPLDSKVRLELSKLAARYGMRLNAYIQFVLGQHVQEKTNQHLGGNNNDEENV